MQTASEADAAQRCARSSLRGGLHQLAKASGVRPGRIAILHRQERQSAHQAGFDHNCLVIQPTCTRQNRTTGHRVSSLAFHPMAEHLEEAIATVTAKEHYSFDPLGPGGRPVGTGDLCGGECPFAPRARSRGSRWSRRVLHPIGPKSNFGRRGEVTSILFVCVAVGLMSGAVQSLVAFPSSRRPNTPFRRLGGHHYPAAIWAL